MTTTTSATSSTTTAAATTPPASSTGTTSSTPDSASIGQSILSSLNANGAGIDTNSLVTELTAAQKAGVEQPILTKQAANTAQISSLATITNDLSTFATSLNTLISGGSLQSQPTISDSSVMSVSAVAGTSIGALSSSVQVTALAQAQTLESQPVAAGTSFASTGGTLTLTVGGNPVVLTAGSDFTDLNSLVSAINAKTAATGVTASQATDASGTHLVLKGKTGAAQAFTLSVAGATNGDTSLNGFAYPPLQADGTPGTDTGNVATGTGMQRVQTAQDAALTVDGVGYTRSSNSFSDVIPGVNMTLTKTGTVSLYATRPTSAITSAVSNFVDAYNLMLGDITTATAAATNTTSAGPLQGNSTLRSLKTQLSQLTTTPLTASGRVHTLAEIGVSTAQDGTLSVDSTKLTQMLAAYPDDVEAMFVSAQSSSNAQVAVSSTPGTVKSGVYTLTGASLAGTTAAGTLDGTAMTSAGAQLSAAPTSAGAGLTLTLLSGVTGGATISVNQGLGGALQAVSNQLLGTSGALTALQSTLKTQQKTLADQLTKADAQVTVYHDQLVTQFTTMNTLVSGYKATQSYLTQQTDIWTYANKGN